MEGLPCCWGSITLTNYRVLFTPERERNLQISTISQADLDVIKAEQPFYTVFLGMISHKAALFNFSQIELKTKDARLFTFSGLP
jgi:hypothetical protein